MSRSRYKSIYRKKRGHGKPIAVIGMVLAAALLLFLGWSIAGPVQRFLTGQIKPSTSSVSTSGTSSKAPSSSKPATSQTNTSSQVIAANAVKGIYLPPNYLTNSTLLDTTLSQSKQSGLNQAIVEMISDDGTVNYNSAATTAISKSVILPGAVDAGALATKITTAGLKPAARISCFRNNAISRLVKDAAVLYSGNHSSRWMDGNKQTWFNPYSDQAQQYVIDMAKELVSLGYKQIYLDNVVFPTAGNPDKQAYFGDSTVSKEQTLKDFVAKITTAVDAVGGKVTVVLPANAVIGTAPANSGLDQDYYAFSSDSVSPIICPSSFGTSLQIGSAAAITNPDLTPDTTTAALANYLKSKASAAKLGATVPFIQAFTNTSLGAGTYKTYTAADIEAEATALSTAGINSFVIYSPNNNYDLTNLKFK